MTDDTHQSDPHRQSRRETLDEQPAADSVMRSLIDADAPKPAARPAGSNRETIDVTVEQGRGLDTLPDAVASGKSPAWPADPNDPTGRLSRHDRLRPGARFGRYRILEYVGGGGMGEVFLAEDTDLDRRVALKVPLFDARDSDVERLVQRFLREARAAATIAHPHVCPLYDVGEIDGIHFITMAFIEGRTLQSAIAEQAPLPPDEAVAIVRKLALALDEAHAHGVVHRDLKPANVMLDRRGEPVILDFGLARRQGKLDVQLTREGSFLGTPAFMSPEQISGSHAEVGPSSDIYSLGVILYELLCGRLPFWSNQLNQLITAVLTEQARPPHEVNPQVSQPLSEACLRCLEKDAGRRFATAGDLAAALAALPKAPVVTAASNAPVERPTILEAAGAGLDRPPARRRWNSVTVLLPVAAVLAVAALLLFLLKSGGEKRAQPELVASNGEELPLDQAAKPVGPGDANAEQPLPPLSPPQLEILLKPPGTNTPVEVNWRKPHLMPLRHDSRLAFKVTLDEPAYLYVYWYRADGQPQRLWPKRPVNQKLIAPGEVWIPEWAAPGEDQLMYPLEGNPGLELALAAVSRTPLTAAEMEAFGNRSLNVVQRQSVATGDVYRVLPRSLGKPVRVPDLAQPIEQSNAAALVIGPGDENRLVLVASFQVSSGAEVPRSLGIPVPTTLNQPLFEDLLATRFDAWIGYLMPHGMDEKEADDR